MTSFKPEEKDALKEKIKEQAKNAGFTLDNSSFNSVWKFKVPANKSDQIEDN